MNNDILKQSMLMHNYSFIKNFVITIYNPFLDLDKLLEYIEDSVKKYNKQYDLSNHEEYIQFKKFSDMTKLNAAMWCREINNYIISINGYDFVYISDIVIKRIDNLIRNYLFKLYHYFANEIHEMDRYEERVTITSKYHDYKRNILNGICKNIKNSLIIMINEIKIYLERRNEMNRQHIN